MEDRSLESSYDFSLDQPNENEANETADSTDVSLLQKSGGKVRLDSLRQNLSKQQERLSALRERALRKSETGLRSNSKSESMESLKSLGHKLQVLKSRVDTSTPLTTPSKEDNNTPDLSIMQAVSGSEKLLMLTQRTEQNRALMEQRKRDLAKSLLSVKSAVTKPNELGSSMTDLRQVAPPVSRHRSAADLEQLDESRLKLLKNKMKLTELKQGRKEQELQDLRQELDRRAQLIEQLELSGAEMQRTVSQQQEELEHLKSGSLQAQDYSRLQSEILPLRSRLTELEQINDLLETTRGELQAELSTAREQLQQQSNLSTDMQVQVELAKQLKDLQKHFNELQTENQQLREQTKLEINDASISERLSELESQIQLQSAQLEEQHTTISSQSEELAEKTTELNVLSVNLRLMEEKLSQNSSSRSKSIFLEDEDSQESSKGEEQLQQLKQKLDEANKINIKLKLKCKQAEKQLKQMDSSSSNSNSAQLIKENEQLQQRICMLEDEKGQWQLLHMQEEEQQQMDTNKQETIRLLEEQKQELQQALEALQQQGVATELSELQMEEQLSQRVQQLEAEAQEQRQQMQNLQNEKDTLDKKLSHYVNENMELLDKLEKLSSSASSAESIEIVERPEEMPAPPSFVSELTQTDVASTQLGEAELLKRIELFNAERREVLTKMEALLGQKLELEEKLKQVEEENQQKMKDMQDRLTELQQAKEDLCQQLGQLTQSSSELQQEKDLLSLQLMQKSQTLPEQDDLLIRLEQLQQEKEQLSLQLMEKSDYSSMQRSSEVVAALDAGDAGSSALFDKCERSLGKLNSELEAYRKANDQKAKFNVSKKLAKEAKNCHTQLTELLQKVKEASTAVETVTVVETVVAVTAPNGKALAEYEQLTAQNAELKAEINRLRQEMEELQEETPQLAIAAGGGDSEIEDKQTLDSKLKLEAELSDLQLKLKDKQQLESQLVQLNVQLELLEEENSQLRLSDSEHLQLIASQSAELTQLQLQTEQFDHLINAKEMSHEQQLDKLTRNRLESEARQESLEGEVRILQTLIAEQKQQLIENLSESEHQLNLKSLEIQSLKDELKEDPQLQQLREQLKINKSLAAQQISELANKQETIDALNQQIVELYQGLEQTKQEEQNKQKDLREKLKKYALNLKKRQQDQLELEQQLKQLREQQPKPEDALSLQNLQEELKAKIHLNIENREALRQLKQQLMDQQTQFEEQQQRLEVELKAAIQANTQLRLEQTNREQHLNELQQQLDQKSLKFDKSKEVIKQRNATIQNLQRQLQSQPPDQQALLLAAQEQHQQLAELYASDKTNFELTRARLETLHEGIQAKLQQNESYIESLEAQTEDLQHRNALLEDQVASNSHQSSEWQNKCQQLEQKLEEISQQSLNDNEQLNERIQILQEREHQQLQKLEELQQELLYLRENLSQIQSDYEALQHKHTQLIAQSQAEREQLLTAHSQEEFNELSEKLAETRSELQRQRQVYDAKLAAKVTELDELECELSAHMERATAETRDLSQQLERSQELVEQKSEELQRQQEDLQELERERAGLSREVTLLRLQQDSAEQDVLELQELRMQVMQDKTEMDNLRAQIDSLCANHTQELQLLQQQLAEMDTLGQNQTDDQMYIETENKRLTEQLSELQARLHEKEEQLISWQRSTSTVPAPAMFFDHLEPSSAPSPFDEIVASAVRVSGQPLSAAPPAPHPSIEALQRNVSDLEKHAQELENKLLSANHYVAELEQMLRQREQELDELKAKQQEEQRLAAVEQLIQPAQAATLDMFFGTETSVPDLGLHQPELADEPLIVPKKAYVCQPQLDLAVDEDPWASAAHEDPLQSRIHQLEQELSLSEQQKLELQTKTAKLMKRLKEYKNKAAAQQDNDLDGAIIDELKHQLQLQELRQVKIEEQLQQNLVEKEKLSKRIEVLTAGNERMTELKERQDMDVQMYQARIRELQEKLNQMENWEASSTATPPDQNKDENDKELRLQLENLQAENVDLNNECQDLQAQLREERVQCQQAKELQEARAKELALEAQAQQAQLQEARAKELALEAQIQQAQLQEKRAKELALEAQAEKAKLQDQLAQLEEKLQQPAQQPPVVVDNEKQLLLLQEKESEIVHLKQRIEELLREDQTEKLVFEILTKNQELQMLRLQVKQLEEDKAELPSLPPPPPAPAVPTPDLIHLQEQLLHLQQEKTDMEEELRVLNNHVLSSLELEDKMKQTVLELDIKNIEITELRKSLELRPHPQVEASELARINQQWESVVEQKCSEVAQIWQEHLSQREAAFQAQLQAASTEGSPDTLLNNMQKALETQEMEIVTLKEQLAIRSAEYARLAAQYDPFRLQNLGGGGGGTQAAASADSDPLPEYVLKADLDYALLMVHQRDMRVEEMIVELVQLLEERDHLQLKLSDTLRQLETERVRINSDDPTGSVTASSSSAASGSPSKISSGSDQLAHPVNSASDLKQKLAELQTVKHSKDKVIVDEREQRLQQMIQLQKDMAKQAPAPPLPSMPTTTTTITPLTSAPAPASQTPLGVDLSQPALRSPSMVLMDWIMGSNKSEDETHHQQSAIN